MKQKIELLKMLRMPKSDGPFIKDQWKVRNRKEVNTDLRLENTVKRERRNSMIYVKGELNYDEAEKD